MVKVLFFGSRPLGAQALRILKSIPNIDLVGMVVKAPPKSAWWRDDPYDMEGLKITHEEAHGIDFDLGVSINYWKMIEKNLIDLPELGFINLHHSYNLSFRGRDMTTHAILNARKNNRWFHGTTLHYTDDGLDTGPVIASASCPITELDTAWTLFEKVEAVGLSLLETWLPILACCKVPAMTPQPDQPLHMRREGEDMRSISDVFQDPLRSYDIVRAYDFNGHYPPATTIINNVVQELSSRPLENSRLLIDLGEGRKIFSKS